MKWLDLVPLEELNRLLPPPVDSPISKPKKLSSTVERSFSDLSPGGIPFGWYFVSDSKLPPEIRDFMIAEGTYPALF